ncbi:branched-chain amino acid ABC transporter permease (plasmid) [Mesorhizobium sp. ORM8.1]
MEGFYYALLTVGISELCRAYASQSRILGASVGGLFGVDGFVPSSLSDKGGLILGYYAALFVLVLSLVLYRIVDGQRLGRLLRAAPEGHEAFAEALGIDYRRVRIQVFLVSSAALGGVGGFYASLQHGVSPSLFTMDQLLLMLGMIVIGGIGTTEGAVAGTLIVVFFDKVLIGFGPARLILIAGIMLLTVLFFRGGLFGSVSQFRAWRAKQKSERADTRTKGSEIMPEQATEIADKQKIYEQRFDVAIRRQLKALITDELIEEHRNSFRERRSENLNRLLTYFRRASVVDKYAVLTIKAFAEYRIVALSGKRGVPPRIVDDKIYPTEEDARHAVFLKRVQDLMEA